MWGDTLVQLREDSIRVALCPLSSRIFLLSGGGPSGASWCGAMLRSLLLAAVIAGSSACSGPRCGDSNAVILSFDRPYPSPYSGGLLLGGRSLPLACPGDGVIDGWRVLCNSDGILVSGPGLKIEGVTFAVVTLAGADGMPLARNLGVPLGPSQFLDDKTCARQATVTLFEVSDVAFIRLDVTSHDFGAVPMGVASAPVTFTVTNRGRSVSGTPVVALSGEFFQPRPGCTVPLNGPGGTCTTTVVFRPTTVGPRNGMLTVAASPGGTVTAALTGEGLPRPADAATD